MGFIRFLRALIRQGLARDPEGSEKRLGCFLECLLMASPAPPPGKAAHWAGTAHMCTAAHFPCIAAKQTYPGKVHEGLYWSRV